MQYRVRLIGWLQSIVDVLCKGTPVTPYRKVWRDWREANQEIARLHGQLDSVRRQLEQRERDLDQVVTVAVEGYEASRDWVPLNG